MTPDSIRPRSDPLAGQRPRFHAAPLDLNPETR